MSKKTEYLLVDGYNIIFSWKSLRELSSLSLEHARIKLADILSNYQGLTEVKVILVFDAHKVNHGIEKVEDYNNIKIVYTKEKETADNYIERVTEDLSKLFLVKVATSDYIEQVIILSKGAYRVSASELLDIVETAELQMRELYTEAEAMKDNLLMNNADVHTKDFLEKLRRDKGGK